ncbi:bile acid:sodium symporter family protein [Bacillus benzoevorans]|nr:bile acid:sodium symporter family protein [Bacillus benzoevorans]
MLEKINKKLTKMMPFITPTGVILGILLSAYLQDFTFLVPWLFAFMTFEGSLSLNFRSVKNALLHPFPVFLTLGLLQIVMPLYAWGIGHLVFNGDSYTITGLILGMVIPTGITSFIWVSIHKGNTALTLAIILIDSLLSPFIVPYSLSILVGQKVELDALGMMSGLFYMIVLPSIAAMVLNQLTKGKVSTSWKPRLMPISKVFLGCVVALNGAVIAPYFKEITFKLLLIALTVLFISICGFFMSFLAARLLTKDNESIVTVTYTAGMRNISAGAVLAVSFFPPAVVLPVVVGMLFQQIISSFVGTFLEKHFQRHEVEIRSA